MTDRGTQLVDEILAVRAHRGRARHVCGQALFHGHTEMVVLCRQAEAILVRQFIDLEAELALVYQADLASSARARA